ncbi:MAG TPA: signal peptidase I [Verrucomicrobiota bacterium]|nr:signal peptidase I [Verrucomicrobiota bacterium]HNU52663.1 signal peptidase I [Verrucomicrobiota bacterium]
MILRWFLSRTVRHAVELRKQVWIILQSQRDELSPKAIDEVRAGLEAFQKELPQTRDRAGVRQAMSRLEECAAKWLKPYPNASTRENIKEFLVSGVLILAIFTFFVQPMKIPSGSAQPTLYGNVVTPLPAGEGQGTIPSAWGKVRDWFRGIDYHEWVTKDSGQLRVSEVETTFRFVKRQRFRIGKDTYTFYWPPETLLKDCGVRPGQPFEAGQTVFRLKVSSGDRLFVDRFTYNFRRPRRGEVIVFTSSGIPGLNPNTHYIKRLIAMGGERVQIGDDRHVVVDGQRLDHTMRHFEFVYSFAGPPKESAYSGHVNDRIAIETLGRSIAPLFPNGDSVFIVRPDHYLGFGDNTLNSHDGRAWGDFPREKVVGKALLVFWPFTSRFGLVWW